MKIASVLLLAALSAPCAAAPAPAPSSQSAILTLPRNRRPAWVGRDGIVMAGSWEPLPFRVRRDGAPDLTPTAEQRAAYAREQSPEMVGKLKMLGVNFVMMHCYKGAGLRAEAQSMADAVRFSRFCRDVGLRVGVYNFSGAFLWEPFFAERPDAEDWVLRRHDGAPVTYGKATYRYYWNRNHPDAQAFYRGLVRFAVEEVAADLIHFDNYAQGPGHDRPSVARFRDFLRATFTPEQLRANGIPDPASALPPAAPGSADLLSRAWTDFCCGSIADSYHDMGRYARTLRPDILVECNPGGVGPSIRPPVDHGRLLTGGEALWDEGRRPGCENGRLRSRIRTYKAARALDNLAFVYVTNPLEAAESMAFNLDCLGAICWFEYANIVAAPGVEKPLHPELDRSVRFFHRRRDLLRDARAVADFALLRSFPSLAFAPSAQAGLTGALEDLLIARPHAYQPMFEHQLACPTRPRVLVLAGCVALGDGEIDAIRRHVLDGGRLCLIGPAATHDRWMLPRPRPALDDLPADRVVRADERGDWLDAIRKACRGRLSLQVAGPGDAPPPAGLAAELTEQPSRRMVHLVNYRADAPARDVSVQVALPEGRTARAVTLAAPGREVDRPIPFEGEAGAVRFTVPEIAVYEIAVITW